MALRFSLPIPLSGADDRSLPPAILPPGAVHGSARQSASFKRISLTRLELKIPVDLTRAVEKNFTPMQPPRVKSTILLGHFKRWCK